MSHNHTGSCRGSGLHNLLRVGSHLERGTCSCCETPPTCPLCYLWHQVSCLIHDVFQSLWQFQFKKHKGMGKGPPVGPPVPPRAPTPVEAATASTLSWNYGMMCNCSWCRDDFGGNVLYFLRDAVSSKWLVNLWWMIFQVQVSLDVELMEVLLGSFLMGWMSKLF